MTSAGNTTTMPKKKQKETLPIPYYLRPNQHQRDMNVHMTELIPELGSPLGQTPMLRNRWYSPSEEYEPGIPCYIPTDIPAGKNGKDELMMGKKSKQRSKQEPSKKTDYIWMPQRGRKNSKTIYLLDIIICRPKKPI